jgi:hypothetical protein
MAVAYIINPDKKRDKKRTKSRRARKNPTPLLIVSNPKRKLKSNGGKKEMAKKKAAKKSPKKHHRTQAKRAVSVNPKRHHRTQAKRAVSVNPKRHHRKHAKKTFAVNPGRKRSYRRNPDTFASIGDFGKQVGLGLTGALATVMGTGYVLNAVAPTLATNKAVLYISEGAVIGGLGLFLHHVAKMKDIAAPVAFGGALMIGLQIASDLVSQINNYIKVSGYGRVSGYGQLTSSPRPVMIANNGVASSNPYAVRAEIYA